MGELVKVRLLNYGGYSGMLRVEYPVITMAEIETVDDRLLAYVAEDDINAIDGCDGNFCDCDDPRWPFVVGTECEIVND